MKQTTRKKKTVKVFGDLKRSLQEALAYEQRKKGTLRGLPFTLAAEFDWTTAMIAPSSRHGEARFFALGYIGNRLHALVFTKSGATVRVISLREPAKRR